MRVFGYRRADMISIRSQEIRRYKYKGDPYYTYYCPDMAVCSHDQRYILRLLSDLLARQKPNEFQLLPQFRVEYLTI